MSRRTIAAGRSCLECRRRKIKCDRGYPCSYCVKTKIDCAYPSPTPRVSTNADDDVVARMDILEEKVGSLERIVLGMKQLLETTTPAVASLSETRISETDSYYDHVQVRNEEVNRMGINHDIQDTSIRFNGLFGSPTDLQDGNQAKNDLLHNISDPYKMEEQLGLLRPHPIMIFFLWSKYLDNVDPVFKILHIPTAQKLVTKATKDPSSIKAADNCLLFAIYYSSVLSMSASECFAELDEDRLVLLKRFRTGLEICLSSVDFVGTPNMTILQAFVIFLMTGRCDADGPNVHSLTGLVIGNALRIGLHRDGEILDLPPFEVEMRRRLWWQICTLDIRIAEEHGSDPCILASSFNTKLPSNISDTALDPDMKAMPSFITGRTEMLCSLVQFETSNICRKLGFSKDFCQENSGLLLSESQKVGIIGLFREHIRKQYLAYCDTNIPLDFITTRLYEMTLANVRLTVTKMSGDHNSDSQSSADLIKICIVILQNAYKVRTYKGGEKWLWLFHPHMELNALAFMLTLLREESDGNIVSSAWKAAEGLFNYWNQSPALCSDGRWEHIETLRLELLGARGYLRSSH